MENKKEKIPKRGSLALCGLGCLGIITESTPQVVEYKDGNKGIAWVGIHLTDKISKIGKPWSSRNPRLLADIEDVEKVLQFVKYILDDAVAEQAQMRAVLKNHGLLSQMT